MWGMHTDGDLPGVRPLPEQIGIEEGCDLLVSGRIFEGFWPGVHDIVDWNELVLHIVDCESCF
jgi:hypothetical protein